MVETNREARVAALGATRQMIATDQFNALVGALIDCRAVPRNVMADVMERLADQWIAKARGDLESNVTIYPAEAFDRARELSSHAAALRGADRR